MQAIIAKYLPCTNTKPTRIKVSCERGSLIVAYDHSGTESAVANVVALLCAKFDAEDEKKYGSVKGHRGSWSRPKASGQIPSGEWVFCFIPS